MFVGTYGSEEDESIQLLEFNAYKETLEKRSGINGIENPSYLMVNQRKDLLYAVSEVEEGEVVAFSIDKDRLKFTEINRQTTKGNAPCYLTLDQKERQLFTVNYGGGSAVSHAIKRDGSLGELANFELYRGETQSHPHMITAVPESNKYIVTDLGLNKLYLYEYIEEHEQLTLVKSIPMVGESGPRHMAIEPKSRKLYVVNEFNSTVSVYSYDQSIENFELIQEIQTIPDDYTGENYCADIHIAHRKGYLYASNRGHHSIAVYKILEDGKLSLVELVSTMGEWPRSFAIVPGEEYMLIANEHTHSIVVMKIWPDGTLSSVEAEYMIKSPVCLRIFDKDLKH